MRREAVPDSRSSDAKGTGAKISSAVTCYVKLNDIALHDKSSQSYGASLAIWDHAVLAVT